MFQLRPLFAVVFVAFIPLLIGVIGLLDPTSTTPRVAMAVVVGVSETVIAASLAFEADRDGWNTAYFGVWMCAGPIVIAGVIFGEAESSDARSKALGVGLTFLVLGLTLLALVIRNQFVRDDVPDLLRQRFPKFQILEAEGVQWAVGDNASVVGADGGWVAVFLQNCVAAARTVQVELKDSTGFLKQTGTLAWPMLPPVGLGPGDAGVLRVPIHATGARRGDVDLYVGVSAGGPAGKRIRRWRARTSSEVVTPSLTLLGTAAGIGIFGGGSGGRRLRFFVPGVASSHPREDARWEPLWIGPRPMDGT